MHSNEANEQEVLNRIAAIQAAAEILYDNDDMPRHERRVFLDVIACEAARLSHRLRNPVCFMAMATS